MSTRVVLQDFAGTYELDGAASDAPDEFLAALGLPYLVRKMAASMTRVQQRLIVQGDALMIENDSALGRSRVEYPVNQGLCQVVVNDEPVPTKTVFDASHEFPLEILGAVPKLKGSTTDRRRLIDADGAMEQSITLQTPEAKVTMRRIFRRTSPREPAALPQTSPITPLALVAPQVPLALDSAVVAAAPLPSLTLAPADAPWPEIALVLGFAFASSSWSLVDCVIWLGVAAALRTGAVPVALAPRQAKAWSLALAALMFTSRALAAGGWSLNAPAAGLGAVAYAYARKSHTESPLKSMPAADRRLAAALVCFGVVSIAWSVVDAVAWVAGAVGLAAHGSRGLAEALTTPVCLLAATRLAFNYADDAPLTTVASWIAVAACFVALRWQSSSGVAARASTSTEQRYAELAVGLVALSLAYAPASQLSYTLAPLAFFAFRHMIMDDGSWTAASAAAAAAPAAAASSSASTASASRGGDGMVVRVLEWRSTRGHIEYLVSVARADGQSTTCWRRYRALLALRDELAVSRSGLPVFPPKQWGGTSATVADARVKALNDFFEQLKVDADMERTLCNHLDVAPAMEENEATQATAALLAARDACLEAAGVGAGNGWEPAGANKYVRVQNVVFGQKSTALVNKPASYVVALCADAKRRCEWDVKASMGCVFTGQFALDREALGDMDAPRPATTQRLVSEEAGWFTDGVVVCDTVGTTFAAPKVKVYIECNAAAARPNAGCTTTVQASGVVAVPTSAQACIVTVVHLATRPFAHGLESAARVQRAAEAMAP